MDESNNKLDSSQVMMNMIKKQFGDLFNAYFIGAPDVIPEAAFPCLVVQKTAASFTAGATMTDDKTEQIMIHVLANGKEGFGTPDDDDTVMRQIQNLVEGVDPASGQFLATSLMHVVRQNITFNDNIIDNSVEINYDVTVRPNQPSIMEAIVVVTTKERMLLPNRY